MIVLQGGGQNERSRSLLEADGSVVEVRNKALAEMRSGDESRLIYEWSAGSDSGCGGKEWIYSV